MRLGAPHAAPPRYASLARHRDRSLQTRLGELSLKIPKLREVSYFPSFLEPRRPPSFRIATPRQFGSGGSRL